MESRDGPVSFVDEVLAEFEVVRDLCSRWVEGQISLGMTQSCDRVRDTDPVDPDPLDDRIDLQAKTQHTHQSPMIPNYKARRS